LVIKLKNLRLFLKNWNKNVFGSVKIKKENLINEIFKINKISETRNFELAERNVLANFKEELNSILEKEKIM